LTADDAIPLNKRGSGTRRLVLLNFFRAQAEDDARDRSNAIYAIEEPETSQHPDHQIMLLEAFQSMVLAEKAQVILTTHTPNLVRRINQENIRFVQVGATGPTIHRGTDEGIPEAIVRTLGLITNHDVKAFVGVEGRNDEAFIRQLSRILSASEEDIADLESAEKSHKLIFVPLGGNNLEVWGARLKKLAIREFYITDRDNSPPQSAKYQTPVDNWNQGGATAWITTKRELENYIHPNAIRGIFADYGGDGTNQFEDVPFECARSHHKSPPAQRQWDELDDKEKDRKVSIAKKKLNNDCVQRMTPELLTEMDPNGELRSWLRQITLAIR
jgi:putative ATP-dependent endonuclease of the OLD family